ncbi:TROVE domain-containing protein [Salininema proteolyticum]|uniref:TROVE domain-containing protein n=1 Tax=Salininema proteolyticum TaxID=1607685 RepID=A0ABV8TYM8_9ACTN
MTRLNEAETRVRTRQPTAMANPEGGMGFIRDAKEELFVLALNFASGKDTAYEKSDERFARFLDLLYAVTVKDAKWIRHFLPWLRDSANMRTVSLIGGLEAAFGLWATNQTGGRQLVDGVLQRADEPGEAVAYWQKNYGRALPKPVKRGIADAVVRLYGERSVLKYDKRNRNWRFADVITHVHPKPKDERQSELFRYLVKARKNRGVPVPDALTTLKAHYALQRRARSNTMLLLNRRSLEEAAFTWEQALSLAGDSIRRAKLWEKLIPTMGYMAILRNLRNFDRANLSPAARGDVVRILTDPHRVAGSRQFPYRFLSALTHSGAERWSRPLQQALELSVGNLPRPWGRYLVLVDQSASMYGRGGGFGTLPDGSVAALTGLLFQRRVQADVVAFGERSERIDQVPGEELWESWKRFPRYRRSHPTRAVQENFDGHDGVVLITDEQQRYDCAGTVRHVLGEDVSLVVWNFGGHALGVSHTKKRTHTFGGVSDGALRAALFALDGAKIRYPFEITD